MANEVLDVLSDNWFLEIKNHGFLSFGRTIDEAGELALKMHYYALNFSY